MVKFIDKDNQTTPNRLRGPAKALAVALLSAQALSGCMPVGEAPEPSPTSSEFAAPTLEEEIASGVEANRLNVADLEVVVANYGSIEEATEAWFESYFTCLTTGNIYMSPENRANFSPSEPSEVKIPRDFQLAENQAVCTNALMDTTSVNNADFIATTNTLNEQIVIKEFAGDIITIVPGDTIFDSVSETGAIGQKYYDIDIKSAVNPETLQTATGFNFIVDADGLLKWNGPRS